MPLRKHEPVSDEAMRWTSPNNSICQVLREIYFTTDDPDTKLRCRLATAMAKAMTAKLKAYKQDWEREFWDSNENHQTQLESRLDTYVPERPVSTMRSKSGKLYDVLYLCANDWANSGYRYAKCLRSLGLNVVGVKVNHHPFFYPETLPTYPDLTNEQAQFLVNHSHVTVLHNTTYIEGIDWSKTNVVAQHGGFSYRQGHNEVNKYLNPIAKATIIQCPDLLGLGAVNEHWISFPVDTDYIKPSNKPIGDRLVFGHFPSVAASKGTAEIVKVIDEIKDPRMEYVGVRPETAQKEIVPWNANLSRIAGCDAYIESLFLKQHDMEVGEFGNQALEAAAMGKAVITNCTHIDRYRKEYGQPPFFVANTPGELYGRIQEVLAMDPETLKGCQDVFRDLVVQHHSIHATAKRMWDKVYRGLFE